MTTTSPDQRPDEATLEFLRSAFEPEWREPALGDDAVLVWESENRVVLPEPYRSLVAEIANGSSLGPPEDGGLLPLGWLPPDWPDQGDRDPAALFPLQDTWAWEGEPLAEDHHERVAAVYNHGSVVLGTDDGLSYWVLVVTGPERGKVWLVTDVGAYPYPMPKALGFLEWVRRWHAGDGWWD
ncbi:SMI1/KNR4 family protein [Streptomyces sp. GbtcB6]|uniref:SMI1/KNR4 family protein n=1 Tax=Streptomyces sp. GbtcB6 TaxID=2824751 RepID=UPI001C30C25E|nr:SMI1/KNR4 family protein [Streptomyces sp. GbtcB6]